MSPIRDMLAETGLTEQQWRVLRVLEENGPMVANQLATAACLLLPSLTRITAAMAAKGLITQVKDENDGRRQVIAITKAGRTIIIEKSDQAANIIESFRARLGHLEYEKLLDLLSSLDPNSKEI